MNKIIDAGNREKYSALRIIILLLQALGWIVIILGILFIFLRLGDSLNSEFFALGIFTSLIIAFIAFIISVALFATAEFLKLLINIEQNVRVGQLTLSNILDKINQLSVVKEISESNKLSELDSEI
ncbi:MAG TPA: hypothetical protein VIH86_05090 [Puia sp.]